MTKTLTYPALALASVMVIVVFATAETYLQLATAVVLYPALVFLAFMVFPRKSLKPIIRIQSPPKPAPDGNIPNPKEEGIPAYVADIDRRTFIKLIGATGISFFLVSLLGRQVENLIFSRSAQSQSNALGNGDQGNPSSSPPADGYNISEIDDEGTIVYYGAINKAGAWQITREDINENSFRYAKGGSDFPNHWANRENLKYDYYHKLPD